MSDIRALRAEVKRLHRNAGSKISRIEADGVRIRGTEFDVRRSAKNIDRYNSRQLAAYAQKLRDFNHRSTTFQASSDGPIPRRLWNEYKHLERMNNIRAERQLTEYANIHIPHTGLTVAEREERIAPKRRRMRTATVARPVAPITRDTPDKIMGAAGLKKLIQQMSRKTNPQRIKARILDQKIEAANMADRLGDPAMKKKIIDLSTSQFNVLWNYTNFAEVMGQAYDSVDTAGEAGRKKIDDLGHLEDIHDRLDWAQSIEGEQAQEQTPESTRKRRRR